VTTDNIAMVGEWCNGKVVLGSYIELFVRGFDPHGVTVNIGDWVVKNQKSNGFAAYTNKKFAAMFKPKDDARLQYIQTLVETAIMEFNSKKADDTYKAVVIRDVSQMIFDLE
jgi:hypothetical protein